MTTKTAEKPTQNETAESTASLEATAQAHAKAQEIENSEYDSAFTSILAALVAIGKLGNNNVLRLAREIGKSVTLSGRPANVIACLVFILRRTAKDEAKGILPLTAKQVTAAAAEMKTVGKANLIGIHKLTGEKLDKALARLVSASAKSDDGKTASTIKFGKPAALEVAFE